MALWKLHIESPHLEQGVRYQPSDPDFVRAAIENLPIRFEEFTFVDIGSGKGRTLLIASEYSFRRIIGVEFSGELKAIADKNIRKYRSKKHICNDISSICADAAVGEDVLRRMLANLKISLMQSRRQVYIVYSNPIFASLLDKSDFLKRVEISMQAAVYRDAFNST